MHCSNNSQRSLPQYGDRRGHLWHAGKFSAADTNPDVRKEVDEKGWCLFKLGGEFADIEAELQRKSGKRS